MGSGDDPHRGLVGGHRLGKIPGTDLAVAVVGIDGQERIIAIVPVQSRLLAVGVGVAGPVVRIAEMDVFGSEYPLYEVDEIPVDNQLVKKLIGVGEVVD